MATDEQRARMLWPDVVASTKMGDDRRFIAEVQTNNNDAGMRIHVYWYLPDNGGKPSLIVEMDDEVLGGEGGEINVRVRRNDGLIFEGTEATTTYIEEEADAD